LVVNLTAPSEHVGQEGLTQAHSDGSRQQNDYCASLMVAATKCIDELLNVIAVWALRRRLPNSTALRT
jgi:hypothetical protein